MKGFRCLPCATPIEPSYVVENLCPGTGSNGPPVGSVPCPACDDKVFFTMARRPEGLKLTQVQIRGMGDWLDDFDSVVVHPAPRAVGWYMDYEGYHRLIEDGCDIYLLNNLSGGLDNLCVDARLMVKYARTGQLEKLHRWLESSRYRIELISQTRFRDPLPAPMPDLTLETGAAYQYYFSKESLDQFVAVALELNRVGWEVFHDEILNEAWMCNRYPRLLRALDAFAKFVPAKKEHSASPERELSFGQHFTDRDGNQRVIISPVDNINRVALVLFSPSWEPKEKADYWSSSYEWAHLTALPSKLDPPETLPEKAMAILHPFRKSLVMAYSFHEQGIQLLTPERSEQFRNGTEDADTWTGWEYIYPYFKEESFSLPFLKRPKFRILVAHKGWASDWESHGPYFLKDVELKLDEILRSATLQKQLGPGSYELDEKKISKIEIYEDRTLVREIHLLKGFGEV